MKTLEELLRSKDVFDVRVSYKGRWLYNDDETEEWVVRWPVYRKGSRVVYRGDDLAEAIEWLKAEET